MCTHTHALALCGWGSGPISWGQLVPKKCVAVGGGVCVRVCVWRWVNERLTMTNSHWLLPSLLINGIKPITTHSFIPLKPCRLLFISHCALSRRVTRDHCCLCTSENAILLEYVNNRHPRPYANKQIPSSRIPHFKWCCHQCSSNKEPKKEFQSQQLRPTSSSQWDRIHSQDSKSCSEGGCFQFCVTCLTGYFTYRLQDKHQNILGKPLRNSQYPVNRQLLLSVDHESKKIYILNNYNKKFQLKMCWQMTKLHVQQQMVEENIMNIHVCLKPPPTTHAPHAIVPADFLFHSVSRKRDLSPWISFIS